MFSIRVWFWMLITFLFEWDLYTIKHQSQLFYENKGYTKLFNSSSASFWSFACSILAIALLILPSGKDLYWA